MKQISHGIQERLKYLLNGRENRSLLFSELLTGKPKYGLTASCLVNSREDILLLNSI